MLDIFLNLIACLLALPVIFLALQLLAANPRLLKSPRETDVNLSKVIIVVPAHNEEVVIESTLNSLFLEVPDKKQIVVVADNCTDRTAKIAREFGVDIIERTNQSELGKGFALKFGVEYLLQLSNKPDYVMVLDADCNIESGSLPALIKACSVSGRPVQALNLMKSNRPDNTKQKVAEFAWMVKNLVRPLGLQKLGLPCQLMGTGMVFPFVILEKIELGSSSIVEDMELGLNCAMLGYPPVFCPAGKVESYFPESNTSQQVQRKRWEHGHLSFAFTRGPGLLNTALLKRNWILLAMTLDLMIPPLTFLVIVVLTAIVMLYGFVSLFNIGSIGLAILLIALLFLFLSLFGSWFRFARDVISIHELLWIPVYIITKIPLYIRYWVSRQTKWVRTDRD